MKKRLIAYLSAALCLILILAAGICFYGADQPAEEVMSYNEFIAAVEHGDISEVIFGSDENFITAKAADGATTYQVPNPKSDDFLESLLLNDIAVSYTGTSGTSILLLLLVAALAGWILYYQFRRRGAGLIQNANKKAQEADMVALTLNDIAGNAEAKAMVEDVIQYIRNPEKYTQLGAKMPRGILFYGPPGTGKTLMAKAIAGEAQVPFYPMSGSDFMQMYVGVGASRVRDLFKKAKKAEKAVIFIDEIDTIGKKRSKQPTGSNDERDQTLNALLSEMSGFHERSGVVVIAATNRLDILDEALTRPGRFDRLIEIGLPDINARRKILELHAGKKPLSERVNLEHLASSTVSFSGAMLENLLNEAAILAANENKPHIEPAHIDKAFYIVVAGAEKADTSYITQQDRKITAYHEAGHALMTKLCLPDSYISKVTIIPSVRGAGGFSFSIPKDTLYLTKSKLIGHMKVLLAGRASEELIFGPDEITTGASNDIEKVSGLVLDYLDQYGMDEEFGLFNGNLLPERSTERLDALCREKIKELYAQTKRQLEENREALEAIASALLEKESLDAEDMDALCA